MATRWGRVAWIGAFVLVALPVQQLRPQEAFAGADGPPPPLPHADPSVTSTLVHQSAMVHVFDTTSLVAPGARPPYVNDHTLVQAKDGAWHLFGIFHPEPMTPDDSEHDFVHAVAKEPDPARWEHGSFDAVPEPHRIALHADRSIGETHLWAPHVVAWEGRYIMVYQGGGKNDYRASIRLAESDDLYRWTRLDDLPAFEDICEARDPMLVHREGAWVVHYTRCDSVTKKLSGVAYRLSHDLVHWSEPRMVMTQEHLPATSNAAYAESPFVFERGGFFWLSLTSYPQEWDATMLYRSPVPTSFPDTPYTRLRAHAAEWIFDRHGDAWLTHAGPGQRGVWLSKVDGL